MKKEMNKEKEIQIDKLVLKCYLNICDYYKVNYQIIEKYLGEIQAKFTLNFMDFFYTFMYLTLKRKNGKITEKQVNR